LEQVVKRQQALGYDMVFVRPKVRDVIGLIRIKDQVLVEKEQLLLQMGSTRK
jgi:hypothetical protein